MREIVGLDLTLLEGNPGHRADVLAELGTREYDAGRFQARVRIFGRMADHQSDHESTAFSQHAGSIPSRQSRGLPPAVHRTIFAVDIAGSTKRVNSVKGQLRRAMYELVEKALTDNGIDAGRREEVVDRGDSVLVLIHPVDEVPKSLLLDAVVPTLTELLYRHNDEYPDLAFRLRAVVHAGEVHWDGHGWFGEALDIAFRLLDAPRTKQGLSQVTAPLVLVISDDIHRSVASQGYAGIDAESFLPAVRVRVAGRFIRGWVQNPLITDPAQA
jgi:hypothetical protein